MRISTRIFAVVALIFVGCAQHHDGVAVVHADSLQSCIGSHVTLIGVAEPRKLGAALRCDGFDVWVADLQDWPTGYAGQRVEVVGVLEERHDLPVFVQKPDELPVQGIPVPEGTDLREASRRYVVRDARWSAIR